MVCKHCGGNNLEKATVCAYCGNSLKDNAPHEYIQTEPLFETITLNRIDPEEEQEIINLHQKMGWTLKHSQEIYNTSTDVHGSTDYYGGTHIHSTTTTTNYVKLTFVRNKKMPNYEILKKKYEEFCLQRDEIARLKKEMNKRPALFWLLSAIPAAIAFIITVSFMIQSAMGSWLFSSSAIIIAIMCGLFVAALVYGIAILIGYAVTSKPQKEKYQPMIDVAKQQMINIADEAEQYI